LRVSVSRESRVTVRVIRAGGLRARTLRRDVRGSRTILVRARGLRAGSYRVAVVATDAVGGVSNKRTFRLRVR
jgi:hypothetical protein